MTIPRLIIADLASHMDLSKKSRDVLDLGRVDDDNSYVA